MENNYWINFNNKCVCFTGELTDIGRKDAENEVKSRNGLISNLVTHEVDYLIVGSVKNTRWKYGDYGRKIKAAIDLRNKYKKPLIIRECDFMDALSLSFPVNDLKIYQKILLIKLTLFDLPNRISDYTTVYETFAHECNLLFAIEEVHYNEFIVYENVGFSTKRNLSQYVITLIQEVDAIDDLSEFKTFIRTNLSKVLNQPDSLIIREIAEGTSAFITQSKFLSQLKLIKL